MSAAYPTVHFRGKACNLKFAFYGNGRVAIRLVRAATSRTPDESVGEPMATASVNLYDEACPPGHVFIKEWSENKGMLDALIAAGVVEPTGTHVPTGHVSAPLCRLLVGPERFRGTK